MNSVANLLREGERFSLVTHKDPDVDGIGSMLALGRALANARKEAVLLTAAPLPAPCGLLPGAGAITRAPVGDSRFDAVVVLDCSERGRAAGLEDLRGERVPIVNIDHHAGNTLFGDLNWVDSHASSTGELVYRVITAAGFRVDKEVAENIFAAVQHDTGCFTYENTTPDAFAVAAEMTACGVKPWEVSRTLMGRHGVQRLRLLEMGLGSLEFHCDGMIGIMSLTSDMLERAGARPEDGDTFVDFPRFVSGVELAVLIRQTGEDEYRFSLRSNGGVNAARMASLFDGGGHVNAAGFTYRGDLDSIRREFLTEARRVLDARAD